MRSPNHIILDFEQNRKVNSNWCNEFITQKKTYNYVFLSFNIAHKFLPLKLASSKILSQQEKFTIKYSNFLNKSDSYNLAQRLTNYNNFHSSPYTNTLKNIININFLRKERLYTKLKYSRSPAYDIVSGGAAALLAGFVGFLISEKFGFELVDSGDFYYLFMYLVFLGFSLRPLLVSINYNDSLRNIFSLKLFINFYLNLIYYFFKR